MLAKLKKAASLNKKPFGKHKSPPQKSVLNISLSDCMCSICLEILVEPVTMPCKHEICLNCFETMLDKTNLMCPMCRMRISNWSRQAANNKALVDQKRWKQIQDSFPSEIKQRIEGKSADDILESLNKILPNHNNYKPGEIKKEYEDMLKREEERRRIEKENEEQASRAVIEQLLLAEGLSFEQYLERESQRAIPQPIPPPPPPQQPPQIQTQSVQEEAISSQQSNRSIQEIDITRNDIPLVENNRTKVIKRQANLGRSQSVRVSRRLASQAPEILELSVVTRSKAKKTTK